MGLIADLDGWTPVRLDSGRDELRVEWVYTEGLVFDDPFFDETIQRCIREPARLLFRRSIPLTAIADQAAPQPTAVIAHMSRCGSTMVSQSLVARGDVLSWSEAPVIDQVVRAAADDRCGIDAVRGVLGVLAAGGCPHSIVKLDAWTSLDLGVVRAAVPEAALVMLVRDPLEVLVSQLRRRGYHMIPGTLPAKVLRLDAHDVHRLEPVEYGAVVLGRILESAFHTIVDDGSAFVVDYTDFPAAIDGLGERLNLTTTGEQLERMRSSASHDAKNPLLPFVDDSAQKLNEATDPMRDAIDRWARPWYERLLEIRARRP